MDRASNIQIVILSILCLAAIFSLGWQFRSFLKGKEICCPWDNCKHNCDELCHKNGYVDLKAVTVEGHNNEVLVCNSYKKPKETEKAKQFDVKV